MTSEWESVTIQDILPEGMTTGQLLTSLKERIYKINNQKTALERGQYIKEYFPAEAADTIRLAKEALEGMLVLPGTGPELYFVGNPPAWSENPVANNEYTFHLNRMHHWKTMSEAYSLTGDLSYAKKVIDEMTNWIDTVPCPALKDENGSYRLNEFEKLSTWRALEVGIRGYRTWPIAVELLADTPYFDEAFLEKLLCCVYLHCKVLYEVSPLLWPKADHNHYLMENLGLLSFSCLFPEMKESQTFLAHAGRQLDRCMAAQCTPCGGQIEGCPSYHNGCVFWFAMRLVFSAKFGLTVPEAYTKQLEKMFRHSVHATRACGGNFPWGDSHIADKETMSLAAVSCYMAYADPDYLATALYFYPASTVLEDIRDNLWRIRDVKQLKSHMEWAVKNPKAPSLPLTAWQKDLNQVYLRSGWEKQALSLMTGCRTPVQNLHAHIDAGGFDFTAFGEPLITDPGIYTYKNDENRRHFKSTLWHNCLSVNKKNMWEYLGSWGYGPQKDGRVLHVSEADGLTYVVSRHENYAPATATRILAMVNNRFLLVIDKVSGLMPEDTIQVSFHVDRTQLLLPNALTVISSEKGRPNAELAVSRTPEGTTLEPAKISTITDIWHDSTIVRFEYSAPERGDFLNAALVVPYPATADTRALTFRHSNSQIAVNTQGSGCADASEETQYEILCTVEEQSYRFMLTDSNVLTGGSCHD